jgi:hypothetical protein
MMYDDLQYQGYPTIQGVADIVMPVEADSFDAAVQIWQGDGVAAFDDPRWETELHLTDQDETELTDEDHNS